jgi:hypothetical protein
MHDHFKESDSGDTDVLEVVRVFLPWFGVLQGFVGSIVIIVESIAGGIDQLDRILELCNYVR